MCGIAAYIGKQDTKKIVLDMLKKLEYRGYDSCGLAFTGFKTKDEEGDYLVTYKSVGKIKKLEEKVDGARLQFKGIPGIGHTRWASCGKVNEQNAHPHLDNSFRVAVVHNGVIDNYDELKKSLVFASKNTKNEITFWSETDTEIIPILISKYIEEGHSKKNAIVKTLNRIDGTYALAIIFSGIGTKEVYVARRGQPLVIGVGKNEHFIASEANVVKDYSDKVIYLQDDTIGIVTENEVEIINRNSVKQKVSTVKIKDEERFSLELGDYDNFMQKEMFEQPKSLMRCFSNRLDSKKGNVRLGGIDISPEELAKISSITIIGCGTSYNAGLVGAFMMERLCNIPCRVEIASEFIGKRISIDPTGIYIAISQSGETYDTIRCVKEIKNKGGRVYGIVNVVSSTIARLCGSGIYVHAGPEIAVASTKAFTSEIAALSMLAIKIGRSKTLLPTEGKRLCAALSSSPELVTYGLKYTREKCQQIAEKYIVDAKYVMYIGRGPSYPVALEGALKLKEIAYIPCEGFPAGEMKHGPIAMIESGTPVVAICPDDEFKTETINNIKELKARNARIIAIGTVYDKELKSIADEFIPTDRIKEHLFSPLLSVVPVQMIAYYTAIAAKTNVDKPRNLAKSVTIG